MNSQRMPDGNTAALKDYEASPVDTDRFFVAPKPCAACARLERELSRERIEHAELRRIFNNVMDQLHAFEERV